MTKSEYIAYIPANEDQFQAATYKYINNNYPQLRGYFFHVPNESASSDLMRIKLASMGVIPGIPDIVCVNPIFAIELKMPNGTQSPKQKRIEQLWSAKGIPFAVCWNANDVCFFLEQYVI